MSRSHRLRTARPYLNHPPQKAAGPRILCGLCGKYQEIGIFPGKDGRLSRMLALPVMAKIFRADLQKNRRNFAFLLLHRPCNRSMSDAFRGAVRTIRSLSHGWNTDETRTENTEKPENLGYTSNCFIRVSSVFHPWLRLGLIRSPKKSGGLKKKAESFDSAFYPYQREKHSFVTSDCHSLYRESSNIPRAAGSWRIEMARPGSCRRWPADWRKASGRRRLRTAHRLARRALEARDCVKPNCAPPNCGPPG